MIILRFVLLAALAGISGLSYSEEVILTLRGLDQSISEIDVHAKQYPPKFDSPLQRTELERKLRDLISILAKATKAYPNDTELLFRQAYANSMGHT